MALRISLLLAIIIACTLSQDCPPLPLLDQANIRFFYNKTFPNNGPSNLIVNYTLDPCFDCLTQFATNVSATAVNSTYFLFSTQWMGSFFIYNESEWALPNHNVPKPFLQSPYKIQQGGYYTFTITDIYATGSNEWQGVEIEYSVDIAGDDIWIPVYIAILIGIGLALLYNLILYIKHIKENYKTNKLKDSSGNLDESRDGLLVNKNDESKIESVARPVAPKGKDMSQRVKSLDTFRGITLSIMIFANAGGGAYVLLDHSPWNGLQLADLLFPWFIWMMGFSMAISYESQRKKGFSKGNMMEKVLMRTFKLAFLGLMSSNFGKPFNDLRIPGVLMRFAVSYFFVSLIIIFVPRKEVSDSSDDKYKVLVHHTYEYIVVLLIIITWLGITFGLSVPGCPTGYIGPGGLLGSYGMYPDCTGGAAGYIDKTILGISHMYDEPTCQPIYLTGPYDPEGILGCLTSMTMVFFGLTAGRVLVYHKTHEGRLKRWLIGAVFMGIISLILTGGTQNDGWIPVNKNLWSLSFITTQCCFGLLTLSTLYVIVDIKKYWGGGPFKAMGMNSITVFCGSVFLSVFFPLSFSLPLVDNGCTNPNQNTHGFLLILALWNSIFFLIMSNWMDYEEFYINL